MKYLKVFAVVMLVGLASQTAFSRTQDSDAKLAAGLQNKIYQAKVFNHGQVTTTLENGVATLSGTVDNLGAIDQVWEKLDERRTSLEKVVADTFRELAKLTTQSAVHARSLYSAVNVIRRAPPAPIFAELVSRPYFVHVGDAYWRFDDSRYAD